MIDIVKILSEFGFPIAMVTVCILFIWQLYKDSVKREDLLRQEIVESQNINKKFAETIAIYTQTLGDIQSDIKETKHDVEQIKAILEDDSQ